MTTEQHIDKLQQARRLVAEAAAGCDIPQIEKILHDADTNLHWALWNLGAPVSLRPELDRGNQ